MNKDPSRGVGECPHPSQTYDLTDTLNDSDVETIGILTTLFEEGGKLRGETFDTVDEDCGDIISPRKRPRGDIRHYFEKDKMTTRKPNDTNYDEWCRGRINTLKKQAEKSSFNDAIMARCRASNL